MKLGVAFREILPEPVVLELDRAYARIRGTWNIEHTDDGAHKDIHATRVESAGGFKEYGRAADVGVWIDIPYLASTYSASGEMTWTVSSGDPLDFSYARHGNTATFSFFIATTVVGGVVSTELQIALPNNFRARKIKSAAVAVNDAGTAGMGRATISEGASVIRITKADGSNWTVGAAEVYGQIAIDVFEDA